MLELGIDFDHSLVDAEKHLNELGWISRIRFRYHAVRHLATAGEHEAVRVWNPLSGRLQAVLDGNFDGTFSLDFSPDSKLLAAGAWSQSPPIWDVETRRLKATLQDHPGLTSKI